MSALRRVSLISKDPKPSSDTKNKEENAKAPRKKRAHPTFGQNLYDYFSEYSNSSSIHGIKYLGEQKRTTVEKLWWLIVFVASLSICIYMIIRTYEKWQSSPVIVSFARSPTPVWQIPFPAVTICSETKSRQTVYNFTDVYDRNEFQKNLTDKELAEFEMISLVCDSHLRTEGNDTIGSNTIDFLTSIAPNFTEVFYECKWMNRDVNCSKLFTPMLTEEGICFTFNMLDRDELFTEIVSHNRDYLHHGIQSTNWTLEDGYPKHMGKDTFPKRALSAGQKAGLSISLRAYEDDLDYICRGPVQGFKLLLHHPAEIPRVSQQYFRAPLNQEVIVTVKPDMMTTSEGLRDYHPRRRQCYFPTERHLRFYKVYTQQNCEVECLTNYTLNACDCVSYHMPHDKKTALCGAGKTLCVAQAQVDLLSEEVEKNLDTYEGAGELEKAGHESCDCLPACTSLTYNSENSQADYNWTKVFQATKINDSTLEGAALTRVTLFFKEMQFITSERNELYGPTDFLASCGGLLGLFMGFSFLSIIEIFYFLSLRLLCNVKNYGHHFWSGSEDLLEDANYEHKK